MSRLAILAVALCLVLAGCNGIADGSAAPDRDPYQVDDPVSPSVTTPVPDEEYPPGLSSDGVASPRHLWDGHRDTLTNRSYSTVAEIAAIDETGSTVFTAEQHSEFDYENHRFAIVERTRGNQTAADSYVRPSNRGPSTYTLPDADAVTVEHWFEPGSQHQRIEAENGSATYVEGREIRALPGDWRLQSTLHAMENVTVDREVYAEGTYYVVTAEGIDPSTDFVADEPFSLTIYIDSNGTIEHFRVEGTVRIEGESLRIVEAVTLYDVDETSVERPDWYDEALAETGDDTRDGTDDGTENETDDGARDETDEEGETPEAETAANTALRANDPSGTGG